MRYFFIHLSIHLNFTTEEYKEVYLKAHGIAKIFDDQGKQDHLPGQEIIRSGLRSVSSYVYPMFIQ
jgi:hypothetical protein